MFFKKRKIGLTAKKGYYGYLFLLPVIIGLVFIYGSIIVESFLMSFSEISNTKDGLVKEWIGWENYNFALRVDPEYVRFLIESVRNMVMNVPIIIIFSLLLANILKEKFRGRTLARAIFFIPVIIATGIVQKIEAKDMIFNRMIDLEGVDTGEFGTTFDTIWQMLDITRLLLNVNLGPRFIGYILDAVFRLYEVITDSGVQLLIFLGGLQSIPAALYEASYIEGATSWENFWKITFPMISPLILVNTIYTIIDRLTDSENRLMHVIFNTAFRQAEYGHASAMSWLYFVAISVVLGLVALIASKLVFYQE